MTRSHEQDRVWRFHRDVIRLAEAKEPHMDTNECHRRARLIAEEACETVAALIGGRAAWDMFDEMAERVHDRKPSLVEYVDGAADLRVVLHGTDLQLGVHAVAAEVYDAVMDSNDAKKGGPIDANGKQRKPPGWTPPDIAGILRNRLGWEE